ADRLVILARAAGLELFHTPGGCDSEAYATVPIKGHLETWLINSKGFRHFLGQLFYASCGKAPGAQAMQDALTVLIGQALHEGPEHETAVRLAEVNGIIYLDLADEEWRSVRIGPDGWSVENKPPVRFVRRRGMLPLPVPVR